MQTALIFKKLFKKKASRFLAIFLLLLFTGTTWQNIMLNKEKKDFSCPGRLIDVNNHRMHIYGEGSGSPTVVFTVGSGTPCAYTDFYFIQQEISKSVRTVTYDRPGYGWSEATSIPRTIDEQVNDLHMLLDKSSEKPPYILAGHSLSSLEVIRFAQLYPEEVVGIVLIDGGSPIYYANYNEPVALLSNILLEGVRKCGIIRALGSIGVLTPIVGEGIRYRLLPAELGQIDKKMFYRNLGNRTNRSEIRNMNENARTVMDSGKLGNIPLVIITSRSDPYWVETQEELKDWSEDSKQETINGAVHYIHWDKPDLVIEKIRELIKETE